MFVGRSRELATLEKLYARDGFEMAVIYGRRRVGKTALISRFAEGKRCLFFTAQQKSEKLNLAAFSRVAYEFFGLPVSTGAFGSWMDALEFVAQRAEEDEPFLFVFDEFPYAAQASPTLPSALQIAIDHRFQQTGLFLILCGSNQGFMESEVLGSKSPLYGRRTAQLKLKPLSYWEAAQLVPTQDPKKLVEYYATFGGTPYYLRQLDPSETLKESTERLFFDIAGVLYAEPQMLLRQELRDPALYSSILDAIGMGATSPKRIAERAGMDSGGVSPYLKTLVDLGIVERVVPFNENVATTRKSIYRLADPLFAFWYRFVSPHADMIEAGLGFAASQFAQDQPFSTYVGHQFEGICLQWLIEQAAENKLPFMPTRFGSWWGSDPQRHEQTDIDVVVANKQDGLLLTGECKWRNSFDESAAIDELRRRSAILRDYTDVWHVLFCKGDVSDATAAKVEGDPRLSVVTARDLYER